MAEDGGVKTREVQLYIKNSNKQKELHIVVGGGVVSQLWGGIYPP